MAEVLSISVVQIAITMNLITRMILLDSGVPDLQYKFKFFRQGYRIIRLNTIQ